MFRENVIWLLGRFKFESVYRATLQSLKQSGSESVAANAARVTDLCSCAYPNFSKDDQLSLAVDLFTTGIADTSSRDYLMCERARRMLEWQEVVRIEHASEAARLSKLVHSNTTAMLLRANQTPVMRSRALLQSTQPLLAVRVICNKKRRTPQEAKHLALITIPKNSRDLCLYKRIKTRVIKLLSATPLRARKNVTLCPRVNLILIRITMKPIKLCT